LSANRIDSAFVKLRADGKRAFIPYIAAGDPSLDITEELVLAFDEAGCDVVELGIPFSDPIADGPSVQRATERALAAGVTVERILRTVERVRRSSDIPLSFMTYYNPIFHYGVDEFCVAAKQAGMDGLIVPDLAVEEADELIPSARAQDIATTFLVAPTSTEERMDRIADMSRGFIYAVSLLGVTGARNTVSPDLPGLMERVRARTDKPVCVGFGISNPEQARAVAEISDGSIVGSAIVNTIEAHVGQATLVSATQAFVGTLVDAVKSV
jgi:tryptophan synthase alpha chain